MMKNPPKKTNPKNLLVTVSFNPQKNDIFKWLLNSCIIEFMGVHLEDKVKTKTNHTLTVLFEKKNDGESFCQMLENYECLEVSKEEC